MFTLRLVLGLIIISGLIAFLGDLIGYRIGKKRLSLFGLRPKRTAALITIFSGIFITLLTLSVMAIFSHDVRVALFSVEKLQQTIKIKNQEFSRLQKNYQEDVLALRKEKKSLEGYNQRLKKTSLKLKEDIEKTRQGFVLYNLNEPIVTKLIKAGKNQKRIKKEIDEVLLIANQIVSKIYGEKRSDWILIPEKEIQDALSFLTSREKEMVIRLVAAQNVVYQEKVPVHLEIFKNVLVFSQNELIFEGLVNGLVKREAVEERIKEILREVSLYAQKKGVVPDQFGRIGNLSYAKLIKLVEEIKAKKEVVNLKVKTENEIKTMGPLTLKFELGEW